jgi:hypothetical protein
MAKGISVSFSGATSAFALEKLERSKLYGTRRRVAMGPDGLACGRASLTDDGQVLLRSGMTAQGYFAADGRQVEASELAPVDCTAPGFLDTSLRYAAVGRLAAARASSGVLKPSFASRQARL